MPASLDKFDRQILAQLQQDCRVPAERMAVAIGLSATAVQRRIRRLRDTGVIRAERAQLDPAALGLGFSALVEVQLKVASRAALIDGFKRRMAEEPQVQQCFYVAGECDFMLQLRCADVAEFERLTRRLFFDDPNILKFRSLVVLDDCKGAGLLPV